ncbi:hypothetical protein GCM10007978_07640 [Shewanella hanedai]|uniref:Putative sugar O-methyltransferase n=1 Tax=Shewanella hanedai TaxID=25 RepID=A0A553JT09_SHEHA|nr:putative sugar O-methyltransferase [Shewanella hanedai]TRY15597.1 putative sugar O-methyltransferase [Shewanella hanedai]GGI72206.1 hypothetical protein GCM10007978_07640 [Shewanella hanedai]
MWKENVSTMIADMKNVDPSYQPSHFWQHGSDRLQQDLEQHGIASFRSLKSALGYFVPTYMFNGWALQPERYHDALELFDNAFVGDKKSMMFMSEFLCGETHAKGDYRVFKASERACKPYTENFSESQVGEPVEQFEFEGKFHSRSSLNYLLGLNFIKQHIDELPIKTVLEIGGGFGSLGEILLSDSRNDSFYIDVDIPPTCLFSSYYLKEVFGSDNIADYMQLKDKEAIDIETLRDQYRGAVMCPWQLPALTGEVDLFVNFISFQEMEPHIVQNYLYHVARLKSKYVLLRNLREGKQVAKDASQVGVIKPIKGDDYDTYLPDYELVATNVLPFGFQTIDNFHSELRLYKLRT